MSAACAKKHEKNRKKREYKNGKVGRPPQQDPDLVPLVDCLAMTIVHFFPEFMEWLNQLPDSRDQEMITYHKRVLVMGAILMFVLRLGSRRQWTSDSKKAVFTQNVNRLVDTECERMPHGDTIEYYLEKNPSEPFEKLNQKMVRRLIRMKALDQFRLHGHLMVAMDGTGQYVFRERHCDNCLSKKIHGGKRIYYHNVLEAKIVCHNGMAISVGTEFIENAYQGLSKQDCELRAFYRLAPKIKKAFPQLPICLLLDGLFAGKPVFDVCKKHNWKYIIVFKEGSMPAQWKEFQALKKLSRKNHVRHQPEAHIVQDFRWVDDFPYEGHCLRLIECKERDKKKDDHHLFVWLTNFDVGCKSVITLANKGGRLRWKIENEGFNTQKNGGYELEHTYSTHTTAMKSFYFLLQIAHLLHQLMEKGSLLKEFKAAFGSTKSLIKQLWEQFRNVIISVDVTGMSPGCSFQIRLDTS